LAWAVSAIADAAAIWACCCWMVAGRLTAWLLKASWALVTEFCACWMLRWPDRLSAFVLALSATTLALSAENLALSALKVLTAEAISCCTAVHPTPALP
jgi:hypothetical protein